MISLLWKVSRLFVGNVSSKARFPLPLKFPHSASDKLTDVSKYVINVIFFPSPFGTKSKTYNKSDLELS